MGPIFRMILGGGLIFAVQDCVLMAVGWISPNFHSVVSPVSALLLILLHFVTGILICSLLAFVSSVWLRVSKPSPLSLAAIGIVSGMLFAIISFILANSSSWGITPVILVAGFAFGYLSLESVRAKARTL